MIHKTFIAHSNWFHVPVFRKWNAIRRTTRTEDFPAVSTMMSAFYHREISPAAHALRSLGVRDPNRRSVGIAIVATAAWHGGRDNFISNDALCCRKRHVIVHRFGNAAGGDGCAVRDVRACDPRVIAVLGLVPVL